MKTGEKSKRQSRVLARILVILCPIVLSYYFYQRFRVFGAPRAHPIRINSTDGSMCGQIRQDSLVARFGSRIYVPLRETYYWPIRTQSLVEIIYPNNSNKTQIPSLFVLVIDFEQGLHWINEILYYTFTANLEKFCKIGSRPLNNLYQMFIEINFSSERDNILSLFLLFLKIKYVCLSFFSAWN